MTTHGKPARLRARVVIECDWEPRLRDGETIEHRAAEVLIVLREGRFHLSEHLKPMLGTVLRDPWPKVVALEIAPVGAPLAQEPAS